MVDPREKKQKHIHRHLLSGSKSTTSIVFVFVQCPQEPKERVVSLFFFAPRGISFRMKLDRAIHPRKKNGKREKWNGGKWRPSKCCRSKFKWRRPSWSVRLPMATRWLARTSTPSANRSTKKANRQSARSPFETAEIERERERERENNSRTKGPGVCVCVCVCVCARGVDRPVGRIETPSLAGNVCQTVSVPQKKKNFWPGNPMMRTMIGRRPSIVPQSAAPRTARWNAHSSRAAVGHCSDEGHHEGFFFLAPSNDYRAATR